MSKSTGEREMELLLKSEGIEFETEVRFHPVRRWRFDFVVKKRVAIEVEGGLFTQGRHTRGKGYIGDMQKYNAAMIGGWRILRYGTAQINNNVIIDILSCWHNLLRRDLTADRTFLSKKEIKQNAEETMEIERRLRKLGCEEVYGMRF